MDLTFHLPMQYCSLQHQTLLPSPVTSTTEQCFCFGSISSFSLELFLHSFPVAYWAPTDLGSSSFSVLSFCLSYCSWGSQGKDTEVVYNSFLQRTTFVRTLHHDSSTLDSLLRMANSFIGLDNSAIHVISLISFLRLWFLFCLPSDG